MEDVLDLYAEPYTTDRPVVCFDELPFQLLADKRALFPAAPGRAARVDYEYRRQGTANLFVCFEPLAGWRHVDVTAQRTNKDFAEQMRALADEHYPTAPRIAVVLVNLSTHSPAALYQTFPPAKARRLVRGWSSITRPSTVAGSTWPNWSLPSSVANAWAGVYRIERRSSARSPPGKPSATGPEPRHIGTSPPHRLAPNYGGSILHDPCGLGLVV
jgi:hypothetical protein